MACLHTRHGSARHRPPLLALVLGFPLTAICIRGRHMVRDVVDACDAQQVLWMYSMLAMTWMFSLVNGHCGTISLLL